MQDINDSDCPPSGPVTRAELTAIQAKVDQLEVMLESIHSALMKPNPGETMSLLDRMARLTIGLEGGARTAKIMFLVLGALAALGFSMKFGIDVRELK